MIIQKNIIELNSKPINIKKKNVPQSTNTSLPLMFNTQLYIGGKGTGKSYKLTQLLKLYENSKIKDNDGIEYDMRIILICPTAQSGANEVFKILKSLNLEEDVYLEYSDELLQGILDDIKLKQEEYDGYIKYKKLYEKFIKAKTLNNFDYEELNGLEEINNKKKIYYLENKEKINIKIKCECCNIEVPKRHIKRHQTSKKHINNFSKINSLVIVE